MTCCAVVSVGSSRLRSACADRNTVNRNKLICRLSHIVTVSNVKLDGSFLSDRAATKDCFHT